MRNPHVSHSIDQRCPRCDEVLSVAMTGFGDSRGLNLACPEPYCDYVWAPTEREIARLTRAAESGEQGGSDPETFTRQAG